MTISSSTSLLDRIESGRFEHAIFLSYSLDLLYFEVAVARHLIRRGCGNVVVFADSRHVAAELVRVADPSSLGGRASWSLGRTYSLTPVFHSSAFHPKIALLIGDDIELVIGSGNLEPGGLRSNLEILHRCQSDRNGTDSEARAIIAETWNYISDRVARRVSSFVRDQLTRVEASVPWIQTQQTPARDAAARLIVGPGIDVVQALQRAVGRDEVTSLIILSPFFDADLAALRRLIKRLHPRRTCLIVQPDTVSAPGNLLRQMVDLVEVYRLVEAKGRYLHAKIVIAECTARSVLLAGSHNVSELAFGGSNFEAGLLRVATRTRFSSDLKLAQHLKPEYRIDLNTTVLRLRPERRPSDNPGNNWLVGAQLDGRVVDVITRRTCSERSRLLTFTRDRLSRPRSRAARAGSLLRFQLDDTSGSCDWTSVAIEDGGVRSAAAPLLVVEALSRTAATPLPQFTRRLKGSSLQLDEVADLLQEFGDWLMAEPGHRTSRGPVRKASAQAPTSAAQGPLTYEDFVVPWERRTQRFITSSAGPSGLEVVVAAIVRAVGGGRGEVAVAAAPDHDDRDEDAGLADRAPYGEEALSRSRLEDNPDTVRELEFEPDANRPMLQPGEGRPAQQRISETPELEEQASAATTPRAARRVARRIDALIDAFPSYIEERCQDRHLGLQTLEAVNAAGRLITAMAGRVIRGVGEQVELLEWTRWAEFHVALLDVVTSERTQFLRQLPWREIRLEAHKRIIEAFVGYLASVRALASMNDVPAELRARILIGVFRAHRILGADQARFRPTAIKDVADAVLAGMSQDLEPPAVAWLEWTRLLSKVCRQDIRLRRKFRAGHEIHAAGVGVTQPSVGDWVWWPHAGEHVATIVAIDDSSIVLAPEPGLMKKVLSSYVVGVC